MKLYEHAVTLMNARIASPRDECVPRNCSSISDDSLNLLQGEDALESCGRLIPRKCRRDASRGPAPPDAVDATTAGTIAVRGPRLRRGDSEVPPRRVTGCAAYAMSPPDAVDATPTPSTRQGCGAHAPRRRTVL